MVAVVVVLVDTLPHFLGQLAVPHVFIHLVQLVGWEEQGQRTQRDIKEAFVGTFPL